MVTVRSAKKNTEPALDYPPSPVISHAMMADHRCPVVYEIDPVYMVPCPTCHAPARVRCRRPSGHSGPFVRFHKERDIAALQAGAYGTCPLGKCPTYAEWLARQAAQEPPLTQGTLFD